MQLQQVFVNGGRLKDTIEAFADFGRTERNGVTRLSLSEQDVQVRNYFAACCEELGMSVTADDMGNMYATLPGAQAGPPVVIGSHLDTVKRGGRFDGVLGVLAGLEVVRTLVDHGIKPRLPVTVMNFTNEEGARFEPSMMASGVLSGKFDKAVMLQKKDPEGTTFAEALAASGFAGDESNRIKEATAYLELHIEQGPVLEKENISIGLVDCVVGMACYEIEVTGESDHAGTTPMDMRKDALFAATEIIAELRGKLGALDLELVYTMGRLNVLPNIHTVIPNKVIFTVEARHKDMDQVRAVEEIILGLPEEVLSCTVGRTKLWGRDTVWFDPQVCAKVEQAAQALGYSARKIASGAGHDAQFVAGFLPSAMIFVPSVNGKSHCEEELTYYEDCEKGVNVVLETVLSILNG
ncbi:Zn-dependent hydrolase [Paenibacillus sp. NFR01]|uniref:Zn-dependent hydrolase n=1 Tax=Paenibacillus sp. NFR01 TaxID=1566279 RepID=UPI0008CA4CF2|nr:Zn-dependent hydrolase [Paenibacillus sp. NFR01]SEU23348.1 N-carbamoyl-L-amino-acid hydrolase [Paenibacillus sp. NFR01]